MEFRHRPVMLEQCVKGLDIRPDGIYVDGTLGGGGHSGAICRNLNERGTLIGIDRDRDALDVSSERLKEYKCKKYFVQSNYSDIKQVLNELKIEKVDGCSFGSGSLLFSAGQPPERIFLYERRPPRHEDESGR